MSIIAKDEGKKFHLPPAGMDQAVCFDVWDLGHQKVEFQGTIKIQHKIKIGWELSERIVSDDSLNGTRHRIYKNYTLSLNDKSNLNKDLSSWRGKPFTDAEKKQDGFDIEKVVGVNCFLNIIHEEANGKTYANISAVNPLPKNTSPIQAENPRSIPEWIAKIQAQSIHPGTVPEEAPSSTDDDIPF